ncbi:MAG: hypothetical protein IBJ10_10055 [Phycisphaerales bacterium]|nr:hypothetical protein [Phycisphaerales bacterium]
MAELATLSNVKPDIWHVHLGADSGYYEGRVNLTVDLVPHEIKALRTGGDVLGVMVAGRVPALDVTFIQATSAELRKLLNIVAGSAPYDLPAVGALLASQAVRLHDPTQPDGANDIVFYAGAITAFNLDADGAGTKDPVVRFTGLRDANGKVLRVGLSTGA